MFVHGIRKLAGQRQRRHLRLLGRDSCDGCDRNASKAKGESLPGRAPEGIMFLCRIQDSSMLRLGLEREKALCANVACGAASRCGCAAACDRAACDA